MQDRNPQQLLAWGVVPGDTSKPTFICLKMRPVHVYILYRSLQRPIICNIAVLTIGNLHMRSVNTHQRRPAALALMVMRLAGTAINQRRALCYLGVDDHQSGSAGAPHGYQFISYCVQSGWLERVGD
jgi:hypothetical protein